MPTRDDFRRLALSLPATQEREAWGHPTFRVCDKMFAAMAADGRSVSVKATKPAQAALIASDPAAFSIPAQVGVHGWIGIDLAGIDAEELRELVTEAWLMTAPKRVARELQL